MSGLDPHGQYCIIVGNGTADKKRSLSQGVEEQIVHQNGSTSTGVGLSTNKGCKKADRIGIDGQEYELPATWGEELINDFLSGKGGEYMVEVHGVRHIGPMDTNQSSTDDQQVLKKGQH